MKITNIQDIKYIYSIREFTLYVNTSIISKYLLIKRRNETYILFYNLNFLDIKDEYYRYQYEYFIKTKTYNSILKLFRKDKIEKILK